MIGLCGAVSAAALGMGPSAAAAPASDARGYLDSTARCAGPALLFGETTGSRVAICENDGGYEYRGVRIRDGATLTAPASKTSVGYAAENAGIEYEVTSTSLVISSGGTVIREERMVDFHGGAPVSAPSTPAPTTPSGPPLAAEVGGSAAPAG